MDKKTLEKINSLTRREFSEKELYTFPVELCNNDIDRDGERFSDAALEQLAKLFIGKTGIFDHNPTASNQNARIFDTEIVEGSSRKTKYGKPYKYLRALAYMVRTDDNKNLIAEIDGGIKKEVSISCSASKKICSVCGSEEPGSCGHKKGEQYGEAICHHILDDVTDAYEWSFVAVPAQINAGVTKKYDPKKEGKSMENEFAPITSQEALDGIISKAVEAAVAEAEKKYEGWKSPEEFTALANERDDLSEKSKAFEAKALRIKAAAEAGLPMELADKLSGETENEIRSDAEMLSKLIRKSAPSSPKFSADEPVKDAKTAAQLAMLAALKNN